MKKKDQVVLKKKLKKEVCPEALPKQAKTRKKTPLPGN